MQTIEREVRILNTQKGAERIADELRAEAFVGQRFTVRPAALDPGKWVVVMFDGEVMAGPHVTFRGGRGVERPEDGFRDGMGERKRKNRRGEGAGKGTVIR